MFENKISNLTIKKGKKWKMKYCRVTNFKLSITWYHLGRTTNIRWQQTIGDVTHAFSASRALGTLQIHRNLVLENSWNRCRGWKKAIPAPSHPEAQIPQANRQPLIWPTIGVSCDWPGRKSGRCVICTADNKRGLRRCCCCCCCYCCCCWSAVQPALMSIFSHCAN